MFTYLTQSKSLNRDVASKLCPCGLTIFFVNKIIFENSEDFTIIIKLVFRDYRCKNNFGELYFGFFSGEQRVPCVSSLNVLFFKKKLP